MAKLPWYMKSKRVKGGYEIEFHWLYLIWLIIKMIWGTMITITNKNSRIPSKSLEVGTEFDADQEVEVNILISNREISTIWLTKEEVKRLIEHLEKLINK